MEYSRLPDVPNPHRLVVRYDEASQRYIYYQNALTKLAPGYINPNSAEPIPTIGNVTLNNTVLCSPYQSEGIYNINEHWSSYLSQMPTTSCPSGSSGTFSYQSTFVISIMEFEAFFENYETGNLPLSYNNYEGDDILQMLHDKFPNGSSAFRLFFKSPGSVYLQTGLLSFQNGQLLSVPEINNIKAVVSPNPVSDVLYVAMPNPSAFDVQVFDLSGRLVNFTRSVGEIDCSELRPGVYMLELTQEGARMTQRIVKR